MTDNITLSLSPAVSLEMVFVEGDAQDKFDKDRYPEIIKDYYIGKYPVTQAQWEAVMKDIKPNPSFYKGKNRPVEWVSWHDAMEFINALNEHLKAELMAIHKKFALPTEAQWEYAARGGVHWRDNFTYAGSDDINKVAWYDENSHRETKPVGLKLPNQLGIYDMSGNVWEWCLSKYKPYPYRTDDGRDVVDNSTDSRVLRGGSWDFISNICSTTYRYGNRPSFRLIISSFRFCLLQFNY
jgi:formylglycine-generating enzyme required for sulfatase activity